MSNKMVDFKLTKLYIEVVREADKYAQLAGEDAIERERILNMVEELIKDNKVLGLDEEAIVAILVASYSYEIGMREGFKQAKELYGVKEQ